MDYGFAVVAILFLVTGFGVEAASVPVAQFCFTLSVVAAVIGIMIADCRQVVSPQRHKK